MFAHMLTIINGSTTLSSQTGISGQEITTGQWTFFNVFMAHRAILMSAFPQVRSMLI